MRKPTFWFPTWCDTDQAVQLQKMARGLKFRTKKVDGLYYVAKTKALISFAVTAKLICVFVFAYAKCWFSHDAAQIYFSSSYLNLRVCGSFSCRKMLLIDYNKLYRLIIICLILQDILAFLGPNQYYVN